MTDNVEWCQGFISHHSIKTTHIPEDGWLERSSAFLITIILWLKKNLTLIGSSDTVQGLWSLQKGFLRVSSSFTLLSALFIYCHIFIYFMLNALNLCPYWFHAWQFEYCSSKTEAILMYISRLIWNILCNKHTLWTLPCSCPISQNVLDWQ